MHGAGAGGGDLVHGLHGFDDEERLSGRHLGADLDEGRGAGLGRAIGGADHRRGDGAGMDDRSPRSRRRTLVAGRVGRRALIGGAPSVVSVVVTLTPRATLTRRPSCSISISVRPVSSSRSASSRIRSLSKVPALLRQPASLSSAISSACLPRCRPASASIASS